jgi:hypothetical protein
VSDVLQLLPYALVATLSPLGFAATIAVMRAGRVKALGFAVGVVVGQLLACSVLVAAGAVARLDRKSHPTLQALLELALGIALLMLAAAVRRRPEAPADVSSSASQARIDRLARLRVGTTLAVGLLLGIGGPKRLVLTALAATSIAASGNDHAEELGLVAWYSLLATILIWAPTLAYVLLGDRAVALLDGGLQWLARNQRRVTFVALLIGGAVIVLHALLTLLL